MNCEFSDFAALRKCRTFGFSLMGGDDVTTTLTSSLCLHTSCCMNSTDPNLTSLKRKHLFNEWLLTYNQSLVLLLSGQVTWYRNPATTAAPNHCLVFFFSLRVSFRVTTLSCCCPRTLCVYLCNQLLSWRVNLNLPPSASWEPYEYQSVTHKHTYRDTHKSII